MTDKIPVGIVAIGRNEGERLVRCLRSAVGPERLVVYVDSGSSDGSDLFAKNLGVEVVELDTVHGFTAARARNAGLRRLLELDRTIEFVQFVDGDCELVNGWLEVARAFLTENSEYAVVCGRRREICPEKNIYHRLTDLEWNTPLGDGKYCGGDAMMRVEAFELVGGYRDSLIAGEEPELCVRLRQRGWKIRRLDEEMTRHDIAMSSWHQWWKRCVRSGHAYAEGAALHGTKPERHWVKERRSIIVWAIALPLGATLLAWPTDGWILLALAVLYLLMVLRIAWATHVSRCVKGVDSLAYGVSCMLGKLPQAIGTIAYLKRRYHGGPSTIIEYKTVISSQGSQTEKAAI